jgi:two-component system, sensor histidine kinase
MLSTARLALHREATGSSSAEAPPTDIDVLIDAARLEALYHRTSRALFFGLLFAGVLVWALFAHLGPLLVGAWFAVKAATTVALSLNDRAYRNAHDRHTNIALWRRRHGLGSLSDGIGWGAAGLLFAPSGDLLLDGMVIAGLVGVASIGVFTLSSHQGHAVRFMMGVLMPLVVRNLFLGAQPLSWILATGFCIYMVVLWLECLRAELHIRELLKLRFENAAIADEREKAWRQAEESSLAKSRFLATVSHELRTPLNGIVGMTELLEQDNPSTCQSARLAVVRQSSGHLLSLIDDLLDLSRIEFGRLELRLAVAPVHALIHEVTDLLAPVAATRGLGLEVTIHDGVPEAMEVDAGRVKQVLHNLLGNALKFTDRGRVLVDVCRRGGLLQITVTDSGSGIAPELLERIFEAFERGRDGQARAGTGLGLTISRQIARAMGGNITASSGASGGASFIFTLECREAKLPDSIGNVDSPPALRFSGKVLVVEDNPVNALVACGMLTRLGLSHHVSENGELALQQLALGGFALVLLDCQMPVLDGWETARRWRHIEAHRGAAAGRLPIVALTANAIAGDRQRCLAAGMDDYIAKPFTLDALAEVLAHYLPPADDSRPTAATVVTPS